MPRIGFVMIVVSPCHQSSSWRHTTTKGTAQISPTVAKHHQTFPCAIMAVVAVVATGATTIVTAGTTFVGRFVVVVVVVKEAVIWPLVIAKFRRAKQVMGHHGGNSMSRSSRVVSSLHVV